ncbi:MAG: 2-amino-4-ketopentanoate thiolase [Synergistaceae bacterium]|nr:2-amino-4-ketopentanoate thiolase [Synergistaceae bacterium]
MERANKGDWVQIRQTVLTPEERAPQVPEDTKKVPLLLWVKGFACAGAAKGEQVEIETVTGRRTKGELFEVNPRYIHDFGDFVPELLQMDMQLKKLLEEDTPNG